MTEKTKTFRTFKNSNLVTKLLNEYYFDLKLINCIEVRLLKLRFHLLKIFISRKVGIKIEK